MVPVARSRTACCAVSKVYMYETVLLSMDCLNPNITILQREIHHKKASEVYVRVLFRYPEDRSEWDGYVPIEYRRTGVFIDTEPGLIDHLNYVYDQMRPSRYQSWLEEQERFWMTKPNADVTKSFFDGLATGGWKCIGCQLPNNPNWARRVQDLKENGYTIGTKTEYCPKCKASKTHLILLPIPRGSAEGNGYETWSPEFRKRIVDLLHGIDAYEGVRRDSCVIDHKFSEIRWDDTVKGENPDNMTDEEILAKFQLLSNQRNQQKREVCRQCYQTGKRGIIYGVSYFFEGGPEWDETIPKRGKDAEKGCIGCPWYDIQEWRRHLNNAVKKRWCRYVDYWKCLLWHRSGFCRHVRTRRIFPVVLGNCRLPKPAP